MGKKTVVNRHMRRGRPWVLLSLGLALLLGVAVSPAMAAPIPIEPFDGGGFTPPYMPPGSAADCYQDCMEKFLENSARCKSIHCNTLFWITFSCDSHLTVCMEVAKEVQEHCFEHCDGLIA